MNRNIYIAGVQPGNGKSIVTLGLMELLKAKSTSVGFFRPVVHSETECINTFITERYDLTLGQDWSWGISKDEASQLLQNNNSQQAISQIMRKYKALQKRVDHVICVGTDHYDGDFLFDLDFNIQIADNLGCSIIPVTSGAHCNPEEINESIESLLHKLKKADADVLTIIVNRMAATEQHLKSNYDGLPIFYIEENPAIDRPTVQDICQSLDAEILWGISEQFHRGIQQFKVAAMEIPHYIQHLETGDLIVVPGDRVDILLASLMAYPSTAYPQISGMVLTGNLKLPDSVKALIDGIPNPPFPILSVIDDTFTTAMNVSSCESNLNVSNPRKIATVLGLFQKSVDVEYLLKSLATQPLRHRTPLMFEYDLISTAQNKIKRIVLPEADDDRILRAAEIIHLRHAAEIILLGDIETVKQRIKSLGLRLDHVEIIDPKQSKLRDNFAATYHQLRAHKQISLDMAYDTVSDVNYFATLMVQLGYADGMVSGANHTTQQTIRPAFEIIRTQAAVSLVSSVFFMCLPDRVLVYGDCAVNPEPDAEQLADIALSSALTAQQFGISPKIAMLSYSSGQSGKGLAVDKVRAATESVRVQRPDLLIEGPIQYDAAVTPSIAKSKMPHSSVAGQANVLIFPDLNTGNNTYKAVQRSAHAVAIGPVLQGLNKPVNDLSRGCTIADVVNTIAITAVQCQSED